MATQYENDIPFTSSHSRQAFKLLELPPDLLALLESSTPPTLTLTSSTTPAATALLSISTSTSPSSPATKTYQLRQKNTSNPIHILSPSSTGPNSAEETEGFVSTGSITSIAVIEDTIELIPIEEGGKMEEKVVKVNKWHEKFAKGRK